MSGVPTLPETRYSQSGVACPYIFPIDQSQKKYLDGLAKGSIVSIALAFSPNDRTAKKVFCAILRQELSINPDSETLDNPQVRVVEVVATNSTSGNPNSFVFFVGPETALRGVEEAILAGNAHLDQLGL